jgi:hypothetical protein
MKFCPVVPEICRGQVHGARKERRITRIIIIIRIIRNGAKTISLQTSFGRLRNIHIFILWFVPKYEVDRGMQHQFFSGSSWTNVLSFHFNIWSSWRGMTNLCEYDITWTMPHIRTVTAQHFKCLRLTEGRSGFFFVRIVPTVCFLFPF